MFFNKEVIFNIIQCKFLPVDNKYSDLVKKLVNSCLKKNPNERFSIGDILEFEIFDDIRIDFKIDFLKVNKSSGRKKNLKLNMSDVEGKTSKKVIIKKKVKVKKKGVSQKKFNMHNYSKSISYFGNIDNNNKKEDNIIFDDKHKSLKLRIPEKNSKKSDLSSQLSNKLFSDTNKNNSLNNDSNFNFSNTEKNIKNNPPLTLTKKKNNHFDCKITLPYSPQNQNLSSKIFDPRKISHSRMMMTTNFLIDKLGKEKYEKIKNVYLSQNYTKEKIMGFLKKEEQGFFKLLEYTFKNKTPSTQYSSKITDLMKNFKF